MPNRSILNDQLHVNQYGQSVHRTGFEVGLATRGGTSFLGTKYRRGDKVYRGFTTWFNETAVGCDVPLRTKVLLTETDLNRIVSLKLDTAGNTELQKCTPVAYDPFYARTHAKFKNGDHIKVRKPVSATTVNTSRVGYKIVRLAVDSEYIISDISKPNKWGTTNMDLIMPGHDDAHVSINEYLISVYFAKV